MATEARESVEKHFLSSRHYLENALVMLNDQEAAKASEFLWGSLAQALQAVAASRNIHLSSHRSLRWFVSNLARELNDRALLDGFWRAQALHSNFHEVDLTVEDVAGVVDPIRTAVSRLLALIPNEPVQEP
jgi:hypothetical protein